MKDFSGLWVDLARQKIQQASSPAWSQPRASGDNVEAGTAKSRGGNNAFIVTQSVVLQVLLVIAVVLVLACGFFFWQMSYYSATVETLQERLMMLENRNGHGWMARLEPLLNEWGEEMLRLREDLLQLAENLRKHQQVPDT